MLHMVEKLRNEKRFWLCIICFSLSILLIIATVTSLWSVISMRSYCHLQQTSSFEKRRNLWRNYKTVCQIFLISMNRWLVSPWLLKRLILKNVKQQLYGKMYLSISINYLKQRQENSLLILISV